MPRGKQDKVGEPDYRILAEFRQNLRQFLHFSEEAANKAGVETQQYQLMLAIKGVPGGATPTIGELAKVMFIKHHSCVGLVDRLEKNKLVQRARHTSDRRRITVRLTRRGETVLRGLFEAHASELKALAPELIRTLAHLLATQGVVQE